MSSRSSTPIIDALTMISSMRPTLHPQIYVYASLPPTTSPADFYRILPHAHSTISESEGISALLPLTICQDPAYKDLLEFSPPYLRHIELRVYSSLEGVGLTAAVAGALAREEISCNMIAGLRHDHVFVPEQDAERAMEVLVGLSAYARDTEGTDVL